MMKKLLKLSLWFLGGLVILAASGFVTYKYSSRNHPSVIFRVFLRDWVKPFHFSDTPAKIRCAAPEFGRHTELRQKSKNIATNCTNYSNKNSECRRGNS
jgi:hypothetical protein